jgi:single-strand DNA-binding protein
MSPFTRTEWHACIVWAKLGEWKASLKKGAFVEVEGELRYREFRAHGSDAKIRSAEIHAISILTLGRGEKSDADESAAAESSNDDETPF